MQIRVPSLSALDELRASRQATDFDGKFSSAIPGLQVEPPQTDSVTQFYGTVASVAEDLQHWKKNTAAWQAEYTSSRKEAAAASAVDETLEFHGRQFEPLQKKYAQDPLSNRYLQNEASQLVRQSLGFMQEYSATESERFVEKVLAEEESELGALLASDYATDEEKKDYFRRYLGKAEAWVFRHGGSEKERKNWRLDLSGKMLHQAMRLKFDFMLQSSPQQAFELMQLVQPELAPQLIHYTDYTGQSQNLGAAPQAVPAQGSQGAALQAAESGQPGAAILQAQPEQEQPDPNHPEQIHSAQLNPGAGQSSLAPAAAQGRLSLETASPEQRKLAAEYGKVFLPEELAQMLHASEAAYFDYQQKRAGYRAVVTASLPDQLQEVLDSGDFSTLEATADQLLQYAYQAEGQELHQQLKLLQLAQPLLKSSSWLPFAAQEKILDEFCARPVMRQKDTAESAAQVQNLLQQHLAAKKAAFFSDPAAAVAGHPALSDPALSMQEFMEKEQLTPAGYTRRSLRLQLEQADSTQFVPRVFSNAQRAEIKNAYDQAPDAAAQAVFLKKLAHDYGSFAAQAMLEAGLAPGSTMFANTLAYLPQSDLERLIKACEMQPEEFALPPEQRQRIQQEVAACSIIQNLRQTEALLNSFYSTQLGVWPGAVASSEFTAKPAAAEPGELGVAFEQLDSTTRLLENFMALGGNPAGLEHWLIQANAAEQERLRQLLFTVYSGKTSTPLTPAEQAAMAEIQLSLGERMALGYLYQANAFQMQAEAVSDLVLEPAGEFVAEVAQGVPKSFGIASRAALESVGQKELADYWGLSEPQNIYDHYMSNFIGLTTMAFGASRVCKALAQAGRTGVALYQQKSATQYTLESMSRLKPLDFFSIAGAAAGGTLAEQAGAGSTARFFAELGGSVITAGSAGLFKTAVNKLRSLTQPLGRFFRSAGANPLQAKSPLPATGPEPLRLTEYETGISSVQSNYYHIIQNNKFWRDAKRGDRKSAIQVVNKYWGPAASESLLKKVDPTQGIVFLPTPSSTGLNQTAAALAAKLQTEFYPEFQRSTAIFRVKPNTRPMKTISKFERPFHTLQYELLDPHALNLLKGKQICLVEDVTTTGSSVKQYALLLERHGIKITTVVSLLGKPIRLDVSPGQVQLLAQALQQHNINLNAQALANVLSEGEVAVILEGIKTSAYDPQSLGQSLQRVLEQRSAGLPGPQRLSK